MNMMIAATVVSDIPDVLSRMWVELGYPLDVCKATNTTFIYKQNLVTVQ